MVLGAREVEVRHVAAVVDDALRIGVREPDARVGRVPKRRLAVGLVPELDHSRMTPSTSSRLRSISSSRERFEVQPQQRLGVRRAHVEVPVVGLDREPVEMRHLPRRAEPLLQLLQLQRDVRDRRVDLAREEVVLAKRREELRQLLPARRDQLEHQQERDHARVGLREVAEVVVRRHLAGEDRVLVAHPLLDERMADAVDQRDAARALDRLGHRPGGAHVVDHLAAGLLLENRLGEQRGREVAGDELARVVDEEAAVGVAVVGDAEVGALLAHLLDDELAVLGQQRIRLVVRERTVGLEVAAHDLDLRQPLEHRRQHRAGHPVRRVDDDPQRSRSPRRRRTRARGRRSRPRCPPSRSRRAWRRATRLAPPGRARRRAPTRLRPAAPRAARSSSRCTRFGLCEAVTVTPPSSPSSPTAK